MRRGGGAGRQAASPQQAAQSATLEDSGILVQDTALSPRCVRSAHIAAVRPCKLSRIPVLALCSAVPQSWLFARTWSTPPCEGHLECAPCVTKHHLHRDWTVLSIARHHARHRAGRASSAPSRTSRCWSSWTRGTGPPTSTPPARSSRGCRRSSTRPPSRPRSATASAAWRQAVAPLPSHQLLHDIEGSHGDDSHERLVT